MLRVKYKAFLNHVAKLHKRLKHRVDINNEKTALSHAPLSVESSSNPLHRSSILKPLKTNLIHDAIFCVLQLVASIDIFIAILMHKTQMN